MVGVLPPGEFGIEAEPEFQNGADAAADMRRAFGRPHRSGDQLQKRALAGAVLPDEAERLSGREGKRDVLDRPEFLGGFDRCPEPTRKPFEAACIICIAFRQVTDGKHGHGYNTSMSSGLARRKNTIAKLMLTSPKAAGTIRLSGLGQRLNNSAS